MRITGGLSRGRTLLGPKGSLVRPTSDRVREALFNILGQDLSGYYILDLFSGTGSLGLEALSRGAAYAVFIDNLNASIALIKKNIERLGYGPLTRVLTRDLTRGIPWEHEFLKGPFDLLFLDPPYALDIAPQLIERMPTAQRLAEGGRVVIETDKKTDLPLSLSRLSRVHVRAYGDTKITIYEMGD